MTASHIAAKASINDAIESAISTVLTLIRRGVTITISLSGGKDSSVVAIICLEAIRRAKLEGVRQATHYVTSSSTRTENPSMESHLFEIHREIEQFCEAHELPVLVKTVTPSLASRFVVSTIGRGTLPRFPENSKHRACSVNWKVQPQQRLTASLVSLAAMHGQAEPVAVIGTRFSESTVRGNLMAARGESSIVPVRDAAGRLVLSLIAEWSLQDVWDTLELFLDKDTFPFPTFTDGASIYRLFELYRDANEGACGINLGDGGNKAPCGPRFGCWNCTIAGDTDKSMESMLREDKYKHMQGLNDFRNLLVATQYDMSRRELVGRTVSEAGYLPVRPDVYRLSFRRQLLAYLLTLDVLEAERAEQLEADIITGKVADTPENRRMAEPQFENVTMQEIVAIDFYWGLNHSAEHAFPALSLWYEIKELGRRYSIPKVKKAEKTAIPAKRWYPVGAFDRETPTDGLRDYQAEQHNPYLHPERPFTHRQVGNDRVVWFEEEDGFEVDAEKACIFVTCEYPNMVIASRNHYALESSRFWLNEEIVKLPAGMSAKYHHMAKRGQYFAHLCSQRNLTPDELDQYLLANSISEAEHEKLCAAIAKTAPPQASLFELEAA